MNSTATRVILPAAEPPTGLMRWRGTLRVRRVGLVFDLRRLTCLDGHRVKVHGRIVASGLQCGHQAHAGGPRCEAWLYLLLMVTDEAAHRCRRFWAADVTLEEIQAIERQHLDAEEIVARFGGSFPAGRVA